VGVRKTSVGPDGGKAADPAGFTLVEILVAVLILGLVAVMVTSAILPAGAGTRSRVDRAHAERAGASIVEELLATDFALVIPGTFGPAPLPGRDAATAEITVQTLNPRLKSLTITVRLGDQESTLMCLKGVHTP
jgi:prepilin-type N-terminal cleavage/methylation domain-containing protein